MLKCDKNKIRIKTMSISMGQTDTQTHETRRISTLHTHSISTGAPIKTTP